MVNGVTLSTPATVRIEGVERPESELREGMEVRVKLHADASGRHGEGLEIQAEDAVNGAGLGTFTVNGVTVRIDALTEQRDAAAALISGDLVEVRGAPGRDGTSLVATRLQRSSDARPVIRGLSRPRTPPPGPSRC